jgi:hypothetical protein
MEHKKAPPRHRSGAIMNKDDWINRESGDERRIRQAAVTAS